MLQLASSKKQQYRTWHYPPSHTDGSGAFLRQVQGRTSLTSINPRAQSQCCSPHWTSAVRFVASNDTATHEGRLLMSCSPVHPCTCSRSIPQDQRLRHSFQPQHDRSFKTFPSNPVHVVGSNKGFAQDLMVSVPCHAEKPKPRLTDKEFTRTSMTIEQQGRNKNGTRGFEAEGAHPRKRYLPFRGERESESKSLTVRSPRRTSSSSSCLWRTSIPAAHTAMSPLSARSGRIGSSFEGISTFCTWEVRKRPPTGNTRGRQERSRAATQPKRCLNRRRPTHTNRNPRGAGFIYHSERRCDTLHGVTYGQASAHSTQPLHVNRGGTMTERLESLTSAVDSPASTKTIPSLHRVR